MSNKKFVLEEYQEPTPEKRSLLDRIFGEDIGNTSKAVAKMLTIFVFIFVFTIGVDELSEAVFGIDSLGNEISIGLGFVTGCILARLAWVRKY